MEKKMIDIWQRNNNVIRCIKSVHFSVIVRRSKCIDHLRTGHFQRPRKGKKLELRNGLSEELCCGSLFYTLTQPFFLLQLPAVSPHSNLCSSLPFIPLHECILIDKLLLPPPPSLLTYTNSFLSSLSVREHTHTHMYSTMRIFNSKMRERENRDIRLNFHGIYCFTLSVLSTCTIFHDLLLGSFVPFCSEEK